MVGESVAPRPRMSVSSGAAPRVLPTVGSRPRMGVTSAAAGTVPARVAMRVRQLVTAPVGFDVQLVGVPAVFQAVPVPVPVHTLGLEMSGGAFANDITVELPTPTVGFGQSAAAFQSVTATIDAPTVGTVAESGTAMLSMGIDKADGQQLGNNVWTKITGWQVRSGYPRTNTSADNLYPAYPGAYVLNAKVTFSGSAASAIRVVVNGTVKRTVGPTTAASQSISSYAITFAAGDEVRLEAAIQTSTTTARVVQSGSTSTFLYFDAA